MKRTHMSSSPGPIILRPVEWNSDDPKGHFKPLGFWYEVDGDWRQWCEGEQWGLESLKHIHRVDLGRQVNLLKIDSVKGIDRFHDEYISKHPFLEYIDWRLVQSRFDGIEIAPYQCKRRLDYMWYYGWDCASGCIWQPRDTKVTYIGPYGSAKESVHAQNLLRS